MAASLTCALAAYSVSPGWRSVGQCGALTRPHRGMTHDLQAKIVSDGWHFPHDDALAYRLELMKERSAFVVTNNGEHFERPFSLCEH